MSSDILDKVRNLLSGVEIEMVSQGAEALVFVSEQHPYLPKNLKPVGIEDTSRYICKYRPRKPYRHPQLDAQLTKSRTAGEAKILNKLESLGVKAPKLLAVDTVNGIIWMEFLGFKLENGSFSSLKNWLWLCESRGDEDATSDHVKHIMTKVGESIAQLHMNDIVHGDLTSSNIVITSTVIESDSNQVSLIDFGLSSYSALPEDKAVDLYVLERALLSTHSSYSEKYNDWFLDGYLDAHQRHKKGSQWRDIERRLALVRLRGRKRSQLG